jgi:hypothetical protein
LSLHFTIYKNFPPTLCRLITADDIKWAKKARNELLEPSSAQLNNEVSQRSYISFGIFFASYLPMFEIGAGFLCRPIPQTPAPAWGF